MPVLGGERGEHLWYIILSTGRIAKIEIDHDQERGRCGEQNPLPWYSAFKEDEIYNFIGTSQLEAIKGNHKIYQYHMVKVF